YSGHRGTLVVLGRRIREILAGYSWDRPIGVNEHQRPPMPQEISADGAGDVDKVGVCPAMRELNTRNESLKESRHEHERPRLTIRPSAKHDPAVACVRLKQPPFVLLEIGAM